MKIEIHAWPYNDINFPQYCLFLSHFQPVTEVYFPFRKKINMLNQKQAENDKIIMVWHSRAVSEHVHLQRTNARPGVLIWHSRAVSEHLRFFHK